MHEIRFYDNMINAKNGDSNFVNNRDGIVISDSENGLRSIIQSSMELTSIQFLGFAIG
jgi:hypothetical protein